MYKLFHCAPTVLLFVGVAICGAILPATDARAAIQSPAVRCAATKLRAAARLHAASVRCRQLAILARQPVAPGCIAAAEAKLLAAFPRAEALGGCATTSDAATVAAAVETCVDDLTALLPVVPITTTTVTSSSTTTTTLSLTCETAAGTCGSCGCGFCYGGPGFPPRSTGICVMPVALGPCGIDPPVPCPAGQLCIVTQFSPFEAFCTEPCP